LERVFPDLHDVGVNTLENPGQEPLPWKEIIGNAAHEMRTPLSCMRTTVEVLRMLTSSSEQTTRMIEILEKQIDSLAGQVDDLVKNPQAYLSERLRSDH
jgi:signal transduction histidine kinase